VKHRWRRPVFKSLAQLPDRALFFADFSVPSGRSETLRLRLPGTRGRSTDGVLRSDLIKCSNVSPSRVSIGL
jgi:hypothetical protein